MSRLGQVGLDLTHRLNAGQMKDFAAMILLFVDQLILQLTYRRKNLKKNPNESDTILKVAVGVPGKVLFVAKVMENLVRDQI